MPAAAHKSLITSIGSVTQLAFVPSDFDATLKFWLETMGVGPFHILKARIETAKYRGQATVPEVTTALGYWDDMQIEIIRQDNAAPSLYREWREAGGEGLHHVCVETDDFAGAKAIAVAAGAELIFDADFFGTEWCYFDTGGGPGTIVEIIRQSPEVAGLMKKIRDSQRGWDGTDPIRYV
jgi:methylmalonyl-CoA/ethylmalonyl-CoA epimerase